MPLTRQRPSERLAQRWTEHFQQRGSQTKRVATSKPVSRSTPLPWDAIVLVLETTPQVNLNCYPQLRGAIARFSHLRTYCFESVPLTLKAALKSRFGDAYGDGSAHFKVGTNAAIVLDFKQIESCSARLGCGVEQVAIAAFLHEVGHGLGLKSGMPDSEGVAWQWARVLNRLHGFVPQQLLMDFEQLTGES
jgi:hypothetical protein